MIKFIAKLPPRIKAAAPSNTHWPQPASHAAFLNFLTRGKTSKALKGKKRISRERHLKQAGSNAKQGGFVSTRQIPWAQNQLVSQKRNSTWPNPETISPGTSHWKLALQQGEPLPQPGMLGTYENKPVGTHLMDSSNWTKTGASSQKLSGNFSFQARGTTGSWLKSEPGQPMEPQAGSASPLLGLFPASPPFPGH